MCGGNRYLKYNITYGVQAILWDPWWWYVCIYSWWINKKCSGKRLEGRKKKYFGGGGRFGENKKCPIFDWLV